ncbi:MAG: DUF2141 domain-containing protein [Candidatus Brocadiia bacterium]
MSKGFRGVVTAALLLAPAVLIFGACGGPAGKEPAPREGAGAIEVTVRGFRNAEGEVLVSLFSAAPGFPNDAERALRTRRVDAAVGTVTVRFEDVPYGEYAVSVLHDENANGRLDTGRLGIPAEGYGASNNPGARFGPPRYKDAAFRLREDVLEVDIELRYML